MHYPPSGIQPVQGPGLGIGFWLRITSCMFCMKIRLSGSQVKAGIHKIVIPADPRMRGQPRNAGSELHEPPAD